MKGMPTSPMGRCVPFWIIVRCVMHDGKVVWVTALVDIFCPVRLWVNRGKYLIEIARYLIRGMFPIRQDVNVVVAIVTRWAIRLFSRRCGYGNYSSCGGGKPTTATTQCWEEYYEGDKAKSSSETSSTATQSKKNEAVPSTASTKNQSTTKTLSSQTGRKLSDDDDDDDAPKQRPPNGYMDFNAEVCPAILAELPGLSVTELVRVKLLYLRFRCVLHYFIHTHCFSSEYVSVNIQ